MLSSWEIVPAAIMVRFVEIITVQISTFRPEVSLAIKVNLRLHISPKILAVDNGVSV